MVNPILFKIFRNLETLRIGAVDHPFSLLLLLSLIKETSIEKVEIEVGDEEETLNTLWSDPKFIGIKGKYKEERYEMERNRSRWLIINKI